MIEELKVLYNNASPVGENIFAEAIEYFLYNNDEGLFMSTLQFYGLLSDNEIKSSNIISPFVDEKKKGSHYSYGLEPFGYTARLNGDEDAIIILPGKSKVLTTLETFDMPKSICGFIQNKSSIIKKLCFCVFAPIEPGFKGQLSFPIFNFSEEPLMLYPKEGIAQVHFIRPSSINNSTYCKGN